ncbi:MAG: sensor histidine kinase [Christensenellales bacterium]|jgi:two-component system sensor histidine kinase AgrC
MRYLAIPAALAVLIAAYITIKRAISRMLDQKIAAYQNDLIEKQVAEVEHMYRQMRAWRHDFHNHIQTMKAMRADGLDAPLDSYLDRLEDDLRTVDTLVRTGNVMVDAILNSKLSLAQGREIKVTVKAGVPASIPVRAVELCVILGNLLDNAMEACARQPAGEARFIRVFIGARKERLYISITNTALGVPETRDGRYRSAKGENHGFGLMRVDKLVDRCGGYLHRAAEEGAFTTEVLL